MKIFLCLILATIVLLACVQKVEMSLLKAFDTDDLFFRHPFVDRFFDDDDLDLFHAFHRSLSHPRLMDIASSTTRTSQHPQCEQPQQQVSPTSPKEQAVTNPITSTNKFFHQLSPLLSSDLVETETEYKIHVDLPGVEASDVDISLVENKHLVIQAERKYVHEETKDKVHSMERSYGKVQRRFRVPANADIDHVTTVFKNGVLSLSFPKKVKEANVRKLQIVTE